MLIYTDDLYVHMHTCTCASQTGIVISSSVTRFQNLQLLFSILVEDGVINVDVHVSGMIMYD